jgi:hypothetical protein
MSDRFDEWELRGGDVNESKFVSMNAQELDEWKLGLLRSANDLAELLNKEVLQLKEEKKALQKKNLETKIDHADALRYASEIRLNRKKLIALAMKAIAMSASKIRAADLRCELEKLEEEFK